MITREPLKPCMLIKKQPPGYKFHTDCYDLHQIIHVCEGRLFIREKSKIRSVETGETLILSPGTAFTLFCKSTGYNGFGVSRSDSRFSNSAEKCLVLPSDKVLSQSFKQAWEEVRNAAGKIEVTAAAVNFIETAVYSRIEPASKPQTLDQWVDRAKNILSRAVHEKYDLMERLASIPVSYEHLSRAFKKREGITLKKFALEMKLREAERLLLENALSITEIAYELGFSSSQHFAVCFKAGRKTPPSAWTKRNPVPNT